MSGPIDVMRRFVMEYQSQNKVEVAEELLANDFVNHTPMRGLPPDREGVKLLFMALRAAFPDLRAEIHDQFTDGDKVVTRKTFYGTHNGDYAGIPATGKQVAISVIDIVRVKDGKMKEHWGTVDQMGLMRQLGVVPAMA